MTKMPKYTSTTNACKLCKPLGACLAFRGIEGAVPYLHGSQGCATYMRRYIISHFNEPIDIASSSLGEKNAIYGGGPNLKQGLANVTAKYHPQLIGIATTCLTETIGDDLNRILYEYGQENREAAAGPLLVKVSTPSYSGTHMEGFHAAVLATIKTLARKAVATGRINLLPGFLSPADLRHLKEITAAFALAATILPDISETLDGPALDEYRLLPDGGTPIAEIRAMAGAQATIEFGTTIKDKESGGVWLETTFGVKNHRLPMPIGVTASDRFFTLLEEISGQPIPPRYTEARGRLIDSLVDGHKYVSGKRAVVYGEEDLVVGLAGFLAEIGIIPVLCGSGGKSGKLRDKVAEATAGLSETPEVYEDIDFHEIEARAAELAPDLIVGHSKGYSLARKLAIPLVRVGFPIHDRLGGQRILHIGYEGAQHLFDTIVNELIRTRQDASPVGYSYM